MAGFGQYYTYTLVVSEETPPAQVAVHTHLQWVAVWQKHGVMELLCTVLGTSHMASSLKLSVLKCLDTMTDYPQGIERFVGWNMRVSEGRSSMGWGLEGQWGGTVWAGDLRVGGEGTVWAGDLSVSGEGLYGLGT